ncbi:MAG: hypothetical protein ACM3WV_10375 [Bacillota bacterium]
MKHYYYSIFSKDYAYKGLLLYKSLERWDPDFCFYMICLHDNVKSFFEKMNLRYAAVMGMAEVEAYERGLKAVKELRNDKEYIWTAKASACLYLFERYPEVNRIAWLDGDTRFYSNPGPIFDEWGKYSIMLTPERWREQDKRLGSTNGIYNTGFMGYRRDANALRCLKWFRDKLLEWCYDRQENGLWSDQVYVNDWPSRFENVGVMRNIGVNATPYIIQGCSVAKKGGSIYVDGQRLVNYHYYGFRYCNRNEYDLCYYNNELSDDAIKWLYLPYIYACRDVMEQFKLWERGLYREAEKKYLYIGNYFHLEPGILGSRTTANFCTVLDHRCAAQGWEMYRSLKRRIKNCRLWVCCADDMSYDLFAPMKLKDAVLFHLRNLVRDKPDPCRYFNDIKVWFMHFLLNNNFQMDSLVYLAPDMTYLKNMERVLAGWGKKPAILYCFRQDALQEGQKPNIYNAAGLIGFKRNPHGMERLLSWAKECLVRYYAADQWSYGPEWNRPADSTCGSDLLIYRGVHPVSKCYQKSRQPVPAGYQTGRSRGVHPISRCC